MSKIPKRFIRVWVGNKDIPELFEKWWQEFKEIHTEYEFITITEETKLDIPEAVKDVIKKTSTCAGVSDILRLIALYEMGGIYIDTDMMPLKKFDELLKDGRPFLGKRSSKSFESAVIGAPAKHPAFKKLIKELPEWWENHKESTASVQTGPAFVSSILFGRHDVMHLPVKTFYPYNGFMAPKREEKLKMFEDKSNFPSMMYAAHLSNHRWGGKPK